MPLIQCNDLISYNATNSGRCTNNNGWLTRRDDKILSNSPISWFARKVFFFYCPSLLWKPSSFCLHTYKIWAHFSFKQFVLSIDRSSPPLRLWLINENFRHFITDINYYYWQPLNSRNRWYSHMFVALFIGFITRYFPKQKKKKKPCYTCPLLRRSKNTMPPESTAICQSGKLNDTNMTWYTDTNLIEGNINCVSKKKKYICTGFLNYSSIYQFTTYLILCEWFSLLGRSYKNGILYNGSCLNRFHCLSTSIITSQFIAANEGIFYGFVK